MGRAISVPHARAQFGTMTEGIAAAYLEERGVRIIARNVRTPVGELDLIGREGRTIVFVEVKARRSAAFGHPEEAVTARKRVHLTHAASAYLAGHAELRGLPYRIDVVAITTRSAAVPEIVHIPNAVGDP